MSDSKVQVFPDSTGKKIDTESITSGGETVERQRVRLGGADKGDLVDVVDGALSITASGVITVDTELPAATALTDTVTNPTVPAIGSFPLLWSPGASQWGRWLGRQIAGAGTAQVAAVVLDNGTAQANMTNTTIDARSTADGVVEVLSLGHGFNGTTWDRLRSGSNDTDSQLPSSIGNLKTVAYIATYDGNNWHSARQRTMDTDGYNALNRSLNTASYGFGFNGTTWDRLRSDVTNGLDVDVTRVQGTVTTSGIVAIASQDGTLFATVRDTGSNDSLNVAIVDASGNQITTFGGGTEVTEDVASAADPIGTMTMARRRDTLSAETTTTGDVTAINCTSKGEMHVIASSTAHDATVASGGVSTNPVIIGGYSEDPSDTAPSNTVSAEADLARLATNRDGALYTLPFPPRIWHVTNEYITQQTDANVKATPGSSLSLYIGSIYIHCTDVVTVTLEEGTSTFKWRFYSSGLGDGASINFNPPMKLTANTALTVTSSAAITFTLTVTGFTGA